jgi:hypothetical protein
MWRSIKRWRDWAMHELATGKRLDSSVADLHYGYEKAGLSIRDQPIPWNAETAFVEVEIPVTTSGPRRKSDFQLYIPRQDIIVPETFRREEASDSQRVYFQFAPPGRTTVAQLVYRGRLLASLTLPALDRDDFIAGLDLQMATLFARFSGQNVACRTFVATQCRGLLFSAVLSSSTSLAPLIELGLRVELVSDHGGEQVAFASLSSSQLSGSRALVTIVPRRFYRRIGNWTATWLVGDRKLAVQEIRAISQRQFRHSLRLLDARFVYRSKNQAVTMARHLPILTDMDRVGPCFFLSSKEPGMAGICNLQMRTQVSSGRRPPAQIEESVLVTDGPTMFAPGTIGAEDLSEVTGFELRCKGNLLGTVPVSPAPTASFNAEGGFKTPSEFSWSLTAEEELSDRMARLFDSRARK